MVGSNKQARCVSPDSLRAGQVRPGRKLLCSTTPAWKSLLVEVYEQPAFVEQYETLASPDVLVVLVLEGEYNIESFKSRTWRKACYRPGVIGITAPNTCNHLRWHSSGARSTRILRASIPAVFFEEAGESFQGPRQKADIAPLDVLSCSDAVVSGVLRSLANAVEKGLPDFYAETGAAFLAAHLTARRYGLSRQAHSELKLPELGDKLLRRTVDLMKCQISEELTLERLAKEAGISRFHFSRLFKAKTGATPHQFLSDLRMQEAKKLLKTTELSVADIALACGYMHTGHFASVFSRVTGQRPNAYRRIL